MAEGARLESVCASNRTEGSNPSLSANYLAPACLGFNNWLSDGIAIKVEIPLKNTLTGANRGVRGQSSRARSAGHDAIPLLAKKLYNCIYEADIKT